MGQRKSTIYGQIGKYVSDEDIFDMSNEIGLLRTMLDDFASKFAEYMSEEDAGDLAINPGYRQTVDTIRLYVDSITKTVERAHKIQQDRKYVLTIEQVYKWQVVLLTVISELLLDQPELRRKIIERLQIASASLPIQQAVSNHSIEGSYKELPE